LEPSVKNSARNKTKKVRRFSGFTPTNSTPGRGSNKRRVNIGTGIFQKTTQNLIRSTADVFDISRIDQMINEALAKPRPKNG